MRLQELVDASNAVAQTSSRLQKTARLADVLKRMNDQEVRMGVSYLSGSLVQGRVGLGWSVVTEARKAGVAAMSSLDLVEVDAAFEKIARTSGSGAAGARARFLAELFVRSTPEEQDFLVRLIMGDLRQGAL